MVNKRVFLGPLAALLTAATVGCGQGVAASSAASKAVGSGHGGILNIATQTDVPSLDPAIGVDSESSQFVKAIFAGLVQWAPTAVKIMPDLASSWKWDKAGTSVTFHLRKAEFSNGAPVTAQDVKFTFERVLNPKTGAFLTSPFMDIAGADTFAAGHASSVSGIVVVNPTTVQFNLVKPEPYFLDALAAGTGGIMDPAVVHKYGKNISQHPVGAGPFELQKWTPGQELVLVRNPHYYNPSLPKLSEIVLKIGLTASQQFEAFQQGKLDIIGADLTGSGTVDPNTYLSVLANPKLKKDLIKEPIFEVYGLFPNAEYKPLANQDVRDAIMYAIDRKHLVQIANGVATVSNQLLPPGLFGYDKNLPQIPLNLAKAKALLKAGHYNPKTVIHLVTTNDPFSVAICTAIQADLAKIGMKIVLEPQAVSTYLNTLANPKLVQISYSFWQAEFPDPQDFLYNMFSSKTYGLFNASYWSTPQVDALLNAADTSTNAALRIKDYTKVQKLVMQGGAEIPLFNGEMDELVQPNLGPTNNPMYFLHTVDGIQFAYIYKK